MDQTNVANEHQIDGGHDSIQPALSHFSSRFSWIISGAACTLLFAIIFVGDLVSSGLYYARTQAQAEQKIAGDLPTTELLKDPVISVVLPSRDIRVQRVADVIALIEAKNFTKALNHLRNSSYPRLAGNASLEERLEQAIALEQEVKQWTAMRQFVGPQQPRAVTAESPDQGNPEVRLNTLTRDLVAMRAQFFRELARYDISETAQMTYTYFRSVLSNWGYTLPQLTLAQSM